MLRLSFLVFLTGLLFSSYSQKVQWASQVLEVSSEASYGKNDKAFKAEQVLGKPSMLVEGLAGTYVWLPAKENSPKEYIKVSFAEAQDAVQIAILECVNLGAIEEVWIYETDDSTEVGEQVLKRYASTLYLPKMFYVHLEQPKKVKAVKVVLNTKSISGYTGIDAIGVSDSKTPITVSINQVEDGVKLKEVMLPNNVNTRVEESYPVVTWDGEEVFFSRVMNPDDTLSLHKIKSTKVVNGSYTRGESVTQFGLDDSQQNVFMSITPDEQTVLLNIFNPIYEVEDGYVFESHKTAAGWSEPVQQQIEGYSNANRYGVYQLSTDQQYMILNTEMQDGYGDLDIYVCFKKADGSGWERLTNLGPTINSVTSESAPTLAADGKTLYFSTESRPGYGGMDVFVSKRLDDTWTNWSEPQNLGPVINNETWNTLISITANGEDVYYSKYTEANHLQLCKGVLPASLQPEPVIYVSGFVKNKNTEAAISTTISYFDSETGLKIGIANSDPQSGEYALILPQGKDYLCIAQQEGYAPDTLPVTNKNLDVFKLVNYDFLLNPLGTGQSYTLQNVIFEQGKEVLLEESKMALDNLLLLMQENPELRIKIEGHTEFTGKAEASANLILSRKRAQTIKNFLIENGISESRIETEGKGGSEPLNTSDVEEERKKHRRVEDIIL